MQPVAPANPTLGKSDGGPDLCASFVPLSSFSFLTNEHLNLSHTYHTSHRHSLRRSSCRGIPKVRSAPLLSFPHAMPCHAMPMRRTFLAFCSCIPSNLTLVLRSSKQPAKAWRIDKPVWYHPSPRHPSLPTYPTVYRLFVERLDYPPAGGTLLNLHSLDLLVSLEQPTDHPVRDCRNLLPC